MKIVSVLCSEISSWGCALLMTLPGRVGLRLRRAFLGRSLGGAKLGLSVERGCDFKGNANIFLGEGASLGRNNVLYASEGRLVAGADFHTNMNVCIVADFGEIVIGDQVLIGMNTVMRAANHRTHDSPRVPIQKQGHESGTIRIGNDVWIGANVCILAGAEIGDHCVIGAGAVVTSKIPSGSVAVGIPARVVRKLAP